MGMDPAIEPAGIDLGPTGMDPTIIHMKRPADSEQIEIY